MQWEYKQVVGKTGFWKEASGEKVMRERIEYSPAVEALNRLGDDGWELVSAAIRGVRDGAETTYTLKRVKAD